MVKKFSLLAGVLMIGIVSCKSQQTNNNPGPQPTGDPTVYKGVTDSECAVEIAFGSYGSGIDGKTMHKVQDLIDAKKLKHSTKSIGREGETRYCIPLKELRGKKRKRFISELKKIAKEGELVSVSIR